MSPSNLPGVMAFYCPDAAMGERLHALVASWEAHTPGLSEAVSITWLRYPQAAPGSSQGPAASTPACPSTAPAVRALGGGGPEAAGMPPLARGACWQGKVLRDPADLVRFVYGCAVEAWLEQDWLEEGPELRRALEAMVRRRSHEATSLVLDLLSGTTSGPSMVPSLQAAWQRQRQLINGWLASLAWPELEGCSACQKTWQDGPYGRDRELLNALGGVGNRFSSEALARLLEAALAGSLLSPPATGRLRDLLQCIPPLQEGASGCSVQGLERHCGSLPAVAQLALPEGSRLWGLTSGTPGPGLLLAYSEVPDQEPVLLVLLCQGDWAATAAKSLQALSRVLLQGAVGAATEPLA